MNKLVDDMDEALDGIDDGAVIAIGGFFAAGVPRALLQALIKRGTCELTLACGAGPLLGAQDELAQLVANKQIKKVIDSYALFRSTTKGLAHSFEQQVRAGSIELEIHPMGTLAEMYRAAAAGIAAFFVPTGSGSVVEQTVLTNLAANRAEKETRQIGNHTCMLEYPLRPDFAFVHAHVADQEGNLRYRKTARNFNQVMASAARVTIAEVEDIVATGEIGGDTVHTPGIYVNRVVKVPKLAFAITNL